MFWADGRRKKSVSLDSTNLAFFSGLEYTQILLDTSSIKRIRNSVDSGMLCKQVQLPRPSTLAWSQTWKLITVGFLSR